MFNFYKIINSHYLNTIAHISHLSIRQDSGSANNPVSLTAVKFFDKPPDDAVYVQNQLGVSLLLAGSVSWDPPTAETGQLLILNGAATGWGNTSSSHDFLSWAWVISYAYAIVQCVLCTAKSSYKYYLVLR